MSLCIFGVSCRQPCIFKFKKHQTFCIVGNCYLEHNLIWTSASEFVGVLLGWFNMYATPAMLIEGHAYRINDWLLSANINIKTFFYMFKRSPKHHIFKILSVGNKAHTCSIEISGSIQAHPAKCDLLILITLKTRARSFHS